jgi:uncharacterized protein (TIGR03084 family)
VILDQEVPGAIPKQPRLLPDSSVSSFQSPDASGGATSDPCSISVDPIVEELAAQHAELAGLLDGLEEAGWHASPRCEGWDISDIVLHLAQTDEMAIGSVTGRFIEVVAELTEGLRSATSVDDGVALMVERERGARSNELFQRWGNDAFRLVDHFDGMDLSARVKWVAGDLSARTLATTRLAETWIHAGDVADALGVELATTDRLRLIARPACRTLPYAFASTGGTLAGPVAFRLTSPPETTGTSRPTSQRSPSSEDRPLSCASWQHGARAPRQHR